jgi:hypothetical protein
MMTKPSIVRMALASPKAVDWLPALDACRRQGRPDRRRRHGEDRQRQDFGLDGGPVMMRVIKLPRQRTRQRLRRQRRILRATTDRALRKEEAMQTLGLRDYAELLVVLGAYAMPLLRLREDDIKRMTDEFLKVWRD